MKAEARDVEFAMRSTGCGQEKTNTVDPYLLGNALINPFIIVTIALVAPSHHG
jgi:hypothetical protein